MSSSVCIQIYILLLSRCLDTPHKGGARGSHLSWKPKSGNKKQTFLPPRPPCAPLLDVGRWSNAWRLGYWAMYGIDGGQRYGTALSSGIGWCHLEKGFPCHTDHQSLIENIGPPFFYAHVVPVQRGVDLRCGGVRVMADVGQGGPQVSAVISL